MSANLRPIILIGAARSGTKILRDALAVALEVPQVPYDVGYVWRYGNEGCPHDALTPADVRPRTRRLAETFLSRYASQGQVIEKTVGNTLRVAYIAEIFPQARFVHVLRDGVDVVDSARVQWETPPDAGYLRHKVRHFPLRLAPSYGRKFVTAALRDRAHGAAHASTWGPRYPGIDDDLRAAGLLTVTARQWVASVRSARRDLRTSSQHVAEVRYESLVQDPTRTLRVIAETLILPTPGLEAAAAMLHAGSHGRGRSRLSTEEKTVVRPEIADLLEELDYDPV